MPGRAEIIPAVADPARMIFLGFGKYVRADRIYALEPLAALDLAERLVEQTQAGRVDLGDLGRRARRLLEASAPAPDESKLF